MMTSSIFKQVHDNLGEPHVRRILERLGVENFTSGGDDHWIVSAPYREDRHPSLSIRRSDGVWNDKATDEGGDLIKLVQITRQIEPLEAAQEIADAIGLNLSAGPQRTTGTAAIEYVYHDEHGDIVGRVMRGHNKKFWQERYEGEQFVKGLAGLALPLYRLPQILGADESALIFVVEGEKDADRLADLGFIATTNAGGAGKFRECHAEYFADRNVIIIPDNDEPGWKHAQQVAGLVIPVAASVKVVELPDLGPRREKHGADISDWLDLGYTQDDLRDIVSGTPIWSDEPTIEGAGPAAPAPGLTVVSLADVRPEQTHWIWHGYVPRAKLTVLDGDPDNGKTTLMLDILARITRGLPMPDGTQSDLDDPENVLLMTAEDGLSDTMQPRMQAAGADLSRANVLTGRVDTDGAPDIIGLPRDIPLIEQEIIQTRAKLMLIDPLMAYLDGSINSHNDQSVRRALTPIKEMAERTGAAVVVIRHLKKSGGPNAKYRGGGSIGIIGSARSGLLVAPDPDDETGERRILALTKHNLHKGAPSLAYRIEGRIVHDDNGNAIDTAAIKWEGSSNYSATELLAASDATDDDTSTGAAADAESFLRQELRRGREPAKDIKRNAALAGVAERTLERAKKKLGVSSEKGSGDNNIWYWVPPRSWLEPDQDRHDPNDGNVGSLGNVGIVPTKALDSLEFQGPSLVPDPKVAKAANIANIDNSRDVGNVDPVSPSQDRNERKRVRL